MAKVSKVPLANKEARKYLERKYETYSSIANDASRSTLKIKSLFSASFAAIVTIVFGAFFASSSIMYVKYDCTNTCLGNDIFEKTSKFLLIAISVILITYCITSIVLNTIWYKRQWVYRQLKKKTDNYITELSSKDTKHISIDSIDKEFVVYSSELKSKAFSKNVCNILKESLVFLVPTIVFIGITIILLIFVV